MVRLLVCGAMACFLACGGEPEACDFDDAGKFSGTYQVSYDEQSGDCGDLPTINILVVAGQDDVDGCTIHQQAEDPAACTTDADVTCMWANGVAVRVVGHLDAEPDGSELSGTATFYASYASNGAAICTSTYAVEYKRQ